MRIFLFIFSCIAVSVWSYVVPDATVEIIKPKGFRISIPNEDGITEVSFNIKIDQSITLYQPGDFAAIIKEPINNRWAFDNINTNIKPGNQINYWIHVIFGRQDKHVRNVGTVAILDNTPKITGFCSNEVNSENQECPATCDLSITTVHGKQVCKGELIFEDTFNNLNWTIWDQEVRIPIASDDGQFVSFQNLPKNCYTKDGDLHIIPTLQSDEPGFNTKLIRSGELNLKEKCTATIDRLLECKRKAQFYQVLPPIVSARINTKKFFSFRYGKVEIRARVPNGDWLFPLILLEPQEHFYGTQDRASGEIRVAFVRGNETFDDISRKVVFGGVVMTNKQEFRPLHMKSYDSGEDLSKNYHTYTLTWTNNHLSFGFDGKDYYNLNTDFKKIHNSYHGPINSNNKMAPFDREFHITLGVAAGGHGDFLRNTANRLVKYPMRWKIGHPKAELDFWKDVDNWHETWQGDNAGLHVDYVKVYAL